MNEKVRIDKYLWCIRIFSTRALATAACHSGKVKYESHSVKAAKNVSIGDKYEIRNGDRKWTIEVTGILKNRVKYEEAVKYYLDLTPEEKKEKSQSAAFYYPTGKRKSKKGRPTKKEKRKLDDFLG